MKDLLLEIGTEEIPAGFLSELVPWVRKEFTGILKKNLILFKSVSISATPRRIAILVIGVEEKQSIKKVEIQGPPEKVAYKDGKPTKALESFLKKNQITGNEIKKKETPRGVYLYAEKEVGGREVYSLLPQLLTDFIQSIKFPKSMRWNATGVTFARPIRWLVALWGEEVIPIEYAGVKAGRVTKGHRFLGNDVEIYNPSQYVKLLLDEYVMVDQDKRNEEIVLQLTELSSEIGGEIPPNEDLLEEVIYLVEYPVVLRGKIDKKFLDLPKEVIITSAQHHQKYFTAVDNNGELLPYFFTVSNMPIEDTSLIVKGNERVLKSRLEDAEFFFREDLKIPLELLIEKLKGVTYQRKLGSLYDKVVRDLKIAEFITNNLGWNDKWSLIERTVKLSKCDLLTNMVYEFPELQGVMGREYALRQGEDEDVAWGIFEHYLPRFAGDDLPQRQTGIVAAISDKVDTVVSGFMAGLKISGAQDPFGLRRSTIGVLQIILERNLYLDIVSTIKVAMTAVEEQDVKSKADFNTILEFFKTRFENIMSDRGFRRDVIRSVIDEDFSYPLIEAKKIEALSHFLEDPLFRDLSIVYKRVVNILKGQSPSLEKFSEEFLLEGGEKRLYEEFMKFKEEFNSYVEKEDFNNAMKKILELKPVIDKFFDDVLVMTDDEKLRNNRLSLLTFINREFRKLADFSKITF